MTNAVTFNGFANGWPKVRIPYTAATSPAQHQVNNLAIQNWANNLPPVTSDAHYYAPASPTPGPSIYTPVIAASDGFRQLDPDNLWIYLTNPGSYVVEWDMTIYQTTSGASAMYFCLLDTPVGPGNKWGGTFDCTADSNGDGQSSHAGIYVQNFPGGYLYVAACQNSGNGQFWVTDLGGGWGVSPDTSQVGQPFFIRAYSINGTLP